MRIKPPIDMDRAVALITTEEEITPQFQKNLA
jgi:hypothetical protein